MPKRFLIIAAILLLCSQAIAISSQEAIDFATKQNNFLYSGETAEIFPNSQIRNKGTRYWVITVLSSGSLAGFIPVNSSNSPGLPDSSIARRELIKTAYALRYEKQLNDSSSKQGTWIFDAKNVKFFSDLAQDLKNEKVDLTTVKTGLDGFPSLQNDADALSSGLDSLHPIASQISDSLREATSFETSFLAGPDTNKLRLFEQKFQDGFDLINELEAERQAYLADKESLRQSIALTDLPIETKKSLYSLANVPNSLQQFGSKVSLAIDLEESLSEVFDNSQSNLDTLTTGLATREKRNSAFQALYGRDEDVLEATQQPSLSRLFNVLQAEENIFLWENQDSLAEAGENWEKAEAFYESGSFKQAENFAARAKGPALRVYADGPKEQQTVFDPSTFYTGIILLIIVLIILYAIRNRGKLKALVSREDQEVELNDWKE